MGLASNSPWFKEKRHLLRMCTTTISATTDGNLDVSSTYPKYGHGEGWVSGACSPVVPFLGPRVGWSIPSLAPLASSCCGPQG